MQFDWDDAAGDAKRRAAGLKVEAMRKAALRSVHQSVPDCHVLPRMWTAAAGMQFDWDDAAGDAKRRAAGLKLEAMRKAEEKRLRNENKGKTYKQGPSGGRSKPSAKAVDSRGPRPGASSSNGKAQA